MEWGSKYKENPAIGAGHSQPSGLNLHIHAATGARVTVPVVSNVTAKDIAISANHAGASNYGGDVDVTSVIAEHKKSLVSEYKCIREYTSRPGEQVLLEDRYVDPLIIQRHRVKKEKEKEIRSRGNVPVYHTDQHITVNELFSQEERPDGVRPKAVILQGNSGSGKSITAQKIVYDWANGNLFAGVFDIVFHLRCSELNVIAGDVSLVDVLNCTEEMAQILNRVPQRVLFLVDGFDELRLSLPKKPLPIKVDIKAQPGAVLSSLLRGCMLNKSYLLITTRSTAVGKLGKLLKSPQRFTEIMGFSPNGIREYFQKFFENDERSGQAYDQVKANGTLYTACSSPVMCWLICNVFKENRKMSNRMRSEFRSTTSVFVDFVFILLEHHCQGLTESQQLDLLKGLGQLAHRGILKGRVLFQRSEVPEMILDVLDSTSIPFLCAFHHTDRINTKEMFSFMHLSFQEFFAALLYTFLDDKEAKSKLKKLLSFSVQGAYHCLPIVQFLFGLSNKAVSKLLMEKHQHTVSRATYAQLTEWLYKFVSHLSVDLSSSALQCLYEVNDKVIVQRAMKIWEKKNYSRISVQLSSMDYHAAAYCLQFCQCITRLNLRGCTMENLRILQTTLSKCDELDLSVSHVSDTDVADLISAVGKGKQLQFLSIEDSALSDQSVWRILSTLRKHKSVGKVHLSVQTINYTNAEIVMNAFQHKVVPGKLRLRVPTKCRHSDENLCFEISYAPAGVSVKHKMLDSYDEHIDSGKSEQAFKTISFSSNDSDFLVDSAFDWRKFLQIASNLKQIETPQFCEHVDTLVSFFHHIPKLEVHLDAQNLSQKCAAKILSFCHAKSVHKELAYIRFKVETLRGRGEEDVCSLSVNDHYTPYFGNIIRLDLKPHEWSPQKAESSTVLQEISLRFPFVKKARVDWKVLLRKLCQTWKSPERYPIQSVLLSVPGLVEVVLRLRSLHEDWAVRILSFLPACTSVLYLEVEVDNGSENLGMVRGDALRDSVFPEKVVLFLGCSHLLYPYDDRSGEDTIELISADQREHKIVPCITLIMANNTEIYNIDWRQFFHSYHQLKGLTTHCPQYDQSLNLLLSVVNSIPGLKEIHLALRFLTVDGAFSIVRLMQTCKSLRKIHVTVPGELRRDFTNSSFPLDQDSETSSVSSDHSGCSFRLDKDSDSESNSFFSDHRYENDSIPVEIENYDLDLCSQLKVNKSSTNEFKLSLRCNSSDADTKAVLEYISLILTEHTEKSRIDWRRFFQAYYDTKGLTESCTEFAGKLKKVLGFLHWVRGLKKVDLGVHSLTETWASYVLNLCYSNRRVDDICLLLEEQDDSDSACSSISVKRNSRDSTVTVKIQRLRYTKTLPSLISFRVPHSELLNIDGCEVLYRMRCLRSLKDKSCEYGREVKRLMHFLRHIPGLRKLKLEIGNLTQGWVSTILSFSTCRSLYKICVTTLYGHLLMEDAILTIQKKWRHRDCTVVLKGLRCSNSAARCTEKNWTRRSHTQCNNMVKLSLHRGFCSQLDGHYKTDSESEEEVGGEREGSESD